MRESSLLSIQTDGFSRGEGPVFFTILRAVSGPTLDR